ncbi:MAG TPA: peptidase E [Candidatus Sulfotelmatobacter sp.]|nr:peptidase E [Candidatus Sulfotelmatobacter sp.]
MAPTRRILAIGGHAWSPAGGLAALDRHLLELTGRDRPKVMFLPTPSADADSSIVSFYETYVTNAVTTHLKLFGAPDRSEWRPRLLEQDAILVSGGNTASALAVWRAHGVDVALREAWEKGAVLCGSSAGMICWFECSVTDSFGARLSGMRDGLGFLAGSACPHYDGEERRRPVYHELVASGFPGGYAAEDEVGLHFEGTALKEVVAQAVGRQAYLVELVDGAVRETALPARPL